MKARRTKATTVNGAVHAMQNALKPIPGPPWPLSAGARQVWDKILVRRSGDEWRAIDYEFAWELAELTVRLREEEKCLAEEGTVIEGGKTNPRHNIVTTMSKRRISLAIYLRVHPGSEAVYAAPGGRAAQGRAGSQGSHAVRSAAGLPAGAVMRDWHDIPTEAMSVADQVCWLHRNPLHRSGRPVRRPADGAGAVPAQIHL